MTRVLASDLNALSGVPRTATSTTTPGDYEDYPFKTPGKRYLAKIDYNLNSTNKFTARYIQLDSNTDVLRLELVVARLRQPSHEHDQALNFSGLELHDPREHQVGRRRVELA